LNNHNFILKKWTNNLNASRKHMKLLNPCHMLEPLTS